MTKKSLGKGLSALLNPLGDDLNSENQILILDIDDIKPNPQQPRKYINMKKIEELAISIRENGVIQPIIVTRKNNEFEIVVGERRWRACKSLKYKGIPAIIKEVTPDKQLEIALIENIQRQDLNCIEEAQTYKQLIHNLNITHEDLSKKIGKSRATITNTIRLLKLPEDIQNHIISRKISEGHARCILGLSQNLKSYLILFEDFIIKNSLPVRKIEILVRDINKIIVDHPILLEKFQEQEDLFNKFLIDILNQNFDIDYFFNKKVIPNNEEEENKNIDETEKINIDKTTQTIKQLLKKEIQEKLYQHLNTKVKLHQKKDQNNGILKIYYQDEDHLKEILNNIITTKI